MLPVFPYWMLIIVCAFSPSEGQDPQGQGLCPGEAAVSKAPFFHSLFSECLLHVLDAGQTAESKTDQETITGRREVECSWRGKRAAEGRQSDRGQGALGRPGSSLRVPSELGTERREGVQTVQAAALRPGSRQACLGVARQGRRDGECQGRGSAGRAGRGQAWQGRGGLWVGFKAGRLIL